ncbi:MAG: glycosyltransferase [Thermodesulfovibrionales bacterium]
MLKKLGLEKKVIFPGFLNREQMRQLYLKCQFALIPSNVETFGHCIVEPFILGRVVISRHVGVADDIIIPGKTGFFFDSEEDLLKVLLAVVSDEGLCTTVAKNAFDQRDQFRWEPICKQHFDLIYDILETH